MVAQVYKFIRLQELGIQKHGEFLQVAAQVLILLRIRCSITVQDHINQLAKYHLIERSTHKTPQLDKEVA